MLRSTFSAYSRFRVLSMHLRTLSSENTCVKVFGHKVPDTDTICSAMVREWDLRQQGVAAQAYRLGIVLLMCIKTIQPRYRQITFVRRVIFR